MARIIIIIPEIFGPIIMGTTQITMELGTNLILLVEELIKIIIRC